MTFVEIDGSKIELPKYTVALAERLRDIGHADSIAGKAKSMYECMCECIGVSRVREKTGADSYEECDLCELANLYNAVNNAYASAMRRTKPYAEESQMQAVREIIDALKEAKTA